MRTIRAIQRVFEFVESVLLWRVCDWAVALCFFCCASDPAVPSLILSLPHILSLLFAPNLLGISQQPPIEQSRH